LRVFVDGSDIKGTTEKGYGIIAKYEDKKYQKMVRANQEIMTNFFGCETKVEKMSNPSMEFAAVGHILKTIYETKKVFPKIHITYDYSSKNWLTAEWKPREPHIRELYKFAIPYYEKLLMISEIGWYHVKSHSGNKNNDRVDKLAKGEKFKGFEKYKDLEDLKLLK